MNVRTTQVQAAVQQLVMEHGEYAPLELLLATNRLAYEDYRAWREGRLETLDAVLADGTAETRMWLDGARSWADALGLACEPAVHHGWEENAGTVLAASADAALNALLSTRYRHTQEHDQLDLFLDSAQTAAVKALLDALAARDAGQARKALERLVRIDRDHGQRFHASRLISALEAPAPEGPERGVEQLERMEREWVPAASALLGARRRDFLAPLWREIARALDPVPFDPSNPGRHASRAYREGLDWGRVRRSVLAVPGHESEAPRTSPRTSRPSRAIGPRGAGPRERGGSARPARGGPLEDARPGQGHRDVVRVVSTRTRRILEPDRSTRLSRLGTAQCVACRFGE